MGEKNTNGGYMKHNSAKFVAMRVGNTDVLGAALKTTKVRQHTEKLKKKFKKISKNDKEEFLLGFIVFLWQSGICLGKKDDIKKVLTNAETTELREAFSKVLGE